MNAVTNDVLLQRWSHITQARNVPFKNWRGALCFWCKWLRKLLDNPTRYTPELKPVIENELAWALADLAYLTTLTYNPPNTPPPVATNHPFIHILINRKHTKPRKVKQ